MYEKIFSKVKKILWFATDETIKAVIASVCEEILAEQKRIQNSITTP